MPDLQFINIKYSQSVQVYRKLPKHAKTLKNTQKSQKIVQNIIFASISLFEDNLHLKIISQRSQKFNLNYSSAKVIARQGKLSNIQKKFAKLKMYLKQPTVICDYKVINQDKTMKYEDNCQKFRQSDQETEQKQSKKKTISNIKVQSTIGYNYFQHLDRIVTH